MEARREAGVGRSFRTIRAFHHRGGWFVAVSEGVSLGPYRNQFEAEVEADLLEHRLRSLGPGGAAAAVREFLLESRERGAASDAASPQLRAVPYAHERPVDRPLVRESD